MKKSFPKYCLPLLAVLSYVPALGMDPPEEWPPPVHCVTAEQCKEIEETLAAAKAELRYLAMLRGKCEANCIPATKDAEKVGEIREAAQAELRRILAIGAEHERRLRQTKETQRKSEDELARLTEPRRQYEQVLTYKPTVAVRTWAEDPDYSVYR